MRAAGRNITGFALRKLIGGGNPSRLKQVWDEHQAGQDAPEDVAELPVEVADELATVSAQLANQIAGLVADLNDRAVKAANLRLAEAIKSAGAQRADMERELADAAETVDGLEAKLDEAQAEVQAHRQRLDNLAEINQTQVVELAQLRERLRAETEAKQEYDALAKLLADELRGELKSVRDQLAALRN